MTSTAPGWGERPIPDILGAHRQQPAKEDFAMFEPCTIPHPPRLLVMFLLGGVLLGAPGPGSLLAEEVELSVPASSLEGVEAFYVEAVADSELASMDLESRDLQGRVGIRLFQGGVRILSEEEYLEDPEAPLVFVSLSMLRISGTKMAYYVSIAVLQGVSLFRDPEIQLAATTWRTDELGQLAGMDRTALLEILDRKTEELVADYVAANPTD